MQTLSYDRLSEQFEHLKGLPVRSYTKAVPKLLIGVNNLDLMVPRKVRERLRREPVAAKTRLGWCIYGGTASDGQRSSVNYHACGCTSDQSLHDLVKDFFTTEEVIMQPVVPLVSEADKRAQRIMEETTIRVGNHFETGLLWKFDHVELPDNYSMALRRLECLEKRMDRNPDLREALQRQLEDYQLKGYAHRATEAELASADIRRVWYLPLGAVVNPRKPGKIRMIWDARAAINGISLNSVLLKGPDQLTSLPGVLVRFRQFKVGVSSDIREMFHQIFIRKEDRHSQRFLWRMNPADNPDVYLMDVATFGSTCSPASAQHIKNKNAREFQELYPRAVEGIVDNHYVDDSLESYESTEEAIRVSQEMRYVHEQGGFELRNWLSNSNDVLTALGETKSGEDKRFAADKQGDYERVLGLLWSTLEDAFSFSTVMKQDISNLITTGERPTKRQMLKCLMSLFDPLGFLSLFVVHGKILLQEVWRTGAQWDEKVNDDLYLRWKNWTQLFEAVSRLKIPRCYFSGATKERYQNLQLHLFVDASESAYCAVAYFRTINNEGIPECALVAAKTKVAPLKTQSIPRLELLAAVLGARLSKFIEENHTLRITRKVFWSDSATVLSWLRADHRRYKQFVACRIGELLTITDVDTWRWVPSKQNPADIATKWGSGPDLNANSVWFKGPAYLGKPEAEWPTQTISTPPTEDELRPCYAHKAIQIPEQLVDITRFSRLSRAVRAAAYVYRFAENLKQKIAGRERFVGPLTSEELRKAESLLIRDAQWQCFPDELMVLQRNSLKPATEQTPLEKSSAIFQLCPILDDQGILRVDSRIGAAPNIDREAKFPVILPRKHALTTLLLDNYHRKYRHGNTETVVNEVRQRYYVPRLRTAVSSMAKTCQWCRVYKCSPKIPRMAPLPLARMASFVKPFTYTGLDFFGPLTVKIGRSNAKRWIAVFTCLTIRAVHVEVAHNLTTDSCMKCIRRFVCRRGAPAEIYSDNGTNFLGAARLLKEQVEQLAVTFTGTTTKWVFNPPGTPHMGGAWERMVRSIKTAVETAFNNNRKLDDEALVTFMVEAESIVNSRPLTYLPLTSEENEAITPNHFLLGNSSGVRQPIAEATDPAEALRSSWHQLQHQLDVFWRRWIREYLPTLTKRPKWCGEVDPIAEGQLVLVVGEGRRNEWTRGRVVQAIKGTDGRIRQAIIQTAKGLVRRPVARLAVLEVDAGKTGPGGQCYGGESVDSGSTVGHDTVTVEPTDDKPVSVTWEEKGMTVGPIKCHAMN
ncbi:uncharacterized protein LOC134286530 [Aedes albopictus]|uniref:Integrase catalytic domain-containing protein n=1 Tax=Aedes albopictus TaxID=7160 RepID=A0ABM1Y073_AEDAL